MADSAPTTAAPARRTMLSWIGGGTSLAAVLAVGVIAFWPASESDKARDDGEAFGAAVVQLDFQTQGPEVQQAFWDGYQDALTAA